MCLSQNFLWKSRFFEEFKKLKFHYESMGSLKNVQLFADTRHANNKLIIRRRSYKSIKSNLFPLRCFQCFDLLSVLLEFFVSDFKHMLSHECTACDVCVAHVILRFNSQIDSIDSFFNGSNSRFFWRLHKHYNRIVRIVIFLNSFILSFAFCYELPVAVRQYIHLEPVISPAD